MCENCDRESSNSSFIFGLVIGAVIAAVVAVYIYKNNKSEVFQNLKSKLEKYFSDLIQTPTPPATPKASRIAKPKKMSVIIPDNVEVLDLKPTLKRKPVKMFKK